MVTMVVGVEVFTAAVSLSDAVTREAARPEARKRWLKLSCMLLRCVS